jgi:hypothetical protein
MDRRNAFKAQLLFFWLERRRSLPYPPAPASRACTTHWISASSLPTPGGRLGELKSLTDLWSGSRTCDQDRASIYLAVVCGYYCCRRCQNAASGQRSSARYQCARHVQYGARNSWHASKRQPQMSDLMRQHHIWPEQLVCLLVKGLQPVRLPTHDLTPFNFVVPFRLEHRANNILVLFL